MKKNNGFSLIELLVVIAIISLLVSILIPSLDKAKQLAMNVKCASNLRSLSTANQMYTADNDGAWACEGSAAGWMYGVARWWDEFGNQWSGPGGFPRSFLQDELVPYFLDAEPTLNAGSYSQVTAFTVCPSFRKLPNYDMTVEYTSGGEASVWAWGTSYYMTEAIAVMCRDAEASLTSGGIHNPGDAAWLFDRRWDCYNQDIQYSYHGKDFHKNVAYADGHVDSVSGVDECVEVLSVTEQLKKWRGY